MFNHILAEVKKSDKLKTTQSSGAQANKYTETPVRSSIIRKYNPVIVKNPIDVHKAEQQVDKYGHSNMYRIIHYPDNSSAYVMYYKNDTSNLDYDQRKILDDYLKDYTDQWLKKHGYDKEQEKRKAIAKDETDRNQLNNDEVISNIQKVIQKLSTASLEDLYDMALEYEKRDKRHSK